MTESEYYGEYPLEDNDLDINELRKTIHNEFMKDLAIAADLARQFPPDWQLDVLLNIMKDM